MMSCDRAHTSLGEKIITAIGCLLLGMALFFCMVVYQITA